MRTQRHFGRLAVSFVLALVTSQEALARPPVWKAQPTEDRAGTGQPYRHDLVNDLADDGGGPVFFFPADTRMPSWLHIDTRRYLTADAGHPALTDTGVFSFDVKATPDPNGDGGILTTFVLTVVGNPDCNGVTKIDMGSSPEDTAFTPFQVANVCHDPAAGGSLTYELTGTPPSWLRMSSAGSSPAPRRGPSSTPR